jgi:predicted O-methyltransferase YrrM
VPIPAASILTAARHAPRGHRLQVLLALLPLFFRRAPTRSTAARCQFRSIEEYRSSYAELGRLLCRPQQTPAPGEIEFLQRICGQAVHYEGAIGAEEFLFLAAIASILAPSRALEIGTSTGFSAAVLAAALHHRHPSATGPLLDTIDLHSRYLIDATKPIGFEIAQLVPRLADAVRVHTGRQSDFVKELARPDELGLVFIDADHQHPWPLLDVLRVAPFVQRSGWIVLHDIELGMLARSRPEEAAGFAFGAPCGAQWLFESWPFAKISGGNIGGIQLPNDKRALAAAALALLHFPFEMQSSSHRRLHKALGQAIAIALGFQRTELPAQRKITDA